MKQLRDERLVLWVMTGRGEEVTVKDVRFCMYGPFSSSSVCEWDRMSDLSHLHN